MLNLKSLRKLQHFCFEIPLRCRPNGCSSLGEEPTGAFLLEKLKEYCSMALSSHQGCNNVTVMWCVGVLDSPYSVDYCILLNFQPSFTYCIIFHLVDLLQSSRARQIMHRRASWNLQQLKKCLHFGIVSGQRHSSARGTNDGLSIKENRPGILRIHSPVKSRKRSKQSWNFYNWFYPYDFTMHVSNEEHFSIFTFLICSTGRFEDSKLGPWCQWLRCLKAWWSLPDRSIERFEPKSKSHETLKKGVKMKKEKKTRHRIKGKISTFLCCKWS